MGQSHELDYSTNMLCLITVNMAQICFLSSVNNWNNYPCYVSYFNFILISPADIAELKDVCGFWVAV